MLGRLWGDSTAGEPPSTEGPPSYSQPFTLPASQQHSLQCQTQPKLQQEGAVRAGRDLQTEVGFPPFIPWFQRKEGPSIPPTAACTAGPDSPAGSGSGGWIHGWGTQILWDTGKGPGAWDKGPGKAWKGRESALQAIPGGFILRKHKDGAVPTNMSQGGISTFPTAPRRKLRVPGAHGTVLMEQCHLPALLDSIPTPPASTNPFPLDLIPGRVRNKAPRARQRPGCPSGAPAARHRRSRAPQEGRAAPFPALYPNPGWARATGGWENPGAAPIDPAQ